MTDATIKLVTSGTAISPRRRRIESEAKWNNPTVTMWRPRGPRSEIQEKVFSFEKGLFLEIQEKFKATLIPRVKHKNIQN